MTLAPDGLPPLREVIARYGLSARKSLGQNFLLNLSLTRRIARASGPLKGATIIEVGPGPGGLTRALLLEGAAQVIVIEQDKRFLAALEEIASHYTNRLHLLQGDALKIDLTPHLSSSAQIVSNLPYNIGTRLLVHWLTLPKWPPWWRSLTLMFQREVAERITATPGDKAYGRLSILAQWRSRAHRVFDISPSAFSPPPKVISTVVHITPTIEPQQIDSTLLERITAAAFAQRRKMLRQSLRSILSAPEKILERANINPERRAETITVDEFLTLTREITHTQTSG